VAGNPETSTQTLHQNHQMMYTPPMKRATITLSDELEAELDAYLARQDAPPSLTAIVQAALQRYLDDKRTTQGAGDRPYPFPLTGDPSEVAEPTFEPAQPDRFAQPGRPGVPAWPVITAGGIAQAPRLGDLPQVLRTLPHLSEDDLGALADDLERSREDLAAAEHRAARDPWNDRGETS